VTFPSTLSTLTAVLALTVACAGDSGGPRRGGAGEGGADVGGAASGGSADSGGSRSEGGTASGGTPAGGDDGVATGGRNTGGASSGGGTPAGDGGTGGVHASGGNAEGGTATVGHAGAGGVPAGQGGADGTACVLNPAPPPDFSCNPESQERVTIQGTSADGSVGFVLHRCMSQICAGGCGVYDVHLSLCYDGRTDEAGSDQIEYTLTHHNWDDSLVATLSDRRLSWQTEIESSYALAVETLGGDVILPDTLIRAQ
jgi:hypothetical protein